MVRIDVEPIDSSILSSTSPYLEGGDNFVRYLDHYKIWFTVYLLCLLSISTFKYNHGDSFNSNGIV